MSTEIQTSYLPQKVNATQIAKLDTVASDFYEICKADSMSPSIAISRAVAMAQIREMLTPEIMAPIMSLQGSPLGFKTDRDTEKDPATGKRVKGKGYPLDIVRDVTIFAMSKGAMMINNEVNILAENPYLAKNYFFRKLNETLGAENWKFQHQIPHVIRQGNNITGAIVKTKILWRDSSNKTGEFQEHEIEHAIKGDDYSSADAFIGKADRKCGNWLLSNITGQRFIDGDVDDAIDVKATTVSIDSKTSSKFTTNTEKKEVKKSEEKTLVYRCLS